MDMLNFDSSQPPEQYSGANLLILHYFCLISGSCGSGGKADCWANEVNFFHGLYCCNIGVSYYIYANSEALHFYVKAN